MALSKEKMEQIRHLHFTAPASQRRWGGDPEAWKQAQNDFSPPATAGEVNRKPPPGVPKPLDWKKHREQIIASETELRKRELEQGSLK